MKEVNLVTPWKNETISYIAQKLKTANQQKFNDIYNKEQKFLSETRKLFLMTEKSDQKLV